MKQEKLKQIRDKIENINTIHHIKFFEILKKHNVNYSENRNGIFINMCSLNKDIINEIEQYIFYINKQEETLNKTEELKKDFKKEFFKDNKEKNEKIYSNNAYKSRNIYEH